MIISGPVLSFATWPVLQGLTKDVAGWHAYDRLVSSLHIPHVMENVIFGKYSAPWI